MKILKTKVICSALLAAFGALGAAGTASAVQLNPAGLGQALIYPYYTVRNAGRGAYNTYLSVVNTTSSTKAVKVRFREGKNSKPVLDFNLYLSPHDVWASAVVPASESDPTAGAKLVTADTSCTTPAYKGNESAFVFSNAAYTNTDGTSIDGETTSIDRTGEGYIEIIEMGAVTGTITAGIFHRNGVPANCGVLDAVTASDTQAGASGGLTGSGTLINVNNGSAFSYNAVALDDFATGVNLWSKPGSALPDLGSASPPVSVMLTSEGVVTSNWADAPDFNRADPVSAVLTHSSLINEFVLDTATASGTDWVITFPTKYAYVGNDTVVDLARQNTAAQRPFQRNFWTGGACDEISLAAFDREERRPPIVSVAGGLPGPPPVLLCWAANVMTFENSFGVPSDLLGSRNKMLAAYTDYRGIFSQGGYQNGWVNVAFPVVFSYPRAAHYMTTSAGASTRVNSRGGLVSGTGQYFGLPAVGFMLNDFINGDLRVGGSSALSNYGGNFDHKGTPLINIYAPL